MISDELLSKLHNLSRKDKLQVIQFLASDLATEEDYLIQDATYEVWSPYDSPQAAEALLNMLAENKHHE